jgi:UDP-N-acetyl-D-mannosaminuronic acid dehydrogenase
MRESPVVELIHMLKAEGGGDGYETVVVDGHVDLDGSKNRDVYEAVKGAHLVVLAVNHKEFKNLDFARIKEAMSIPQVLDTRNFWDVKTIEQAGLNYHLLGWGR